MLTRPYLQSLRYQPSATVDFESYPFSIPAVRELEHIDFHPNVTFLVGENGSGKSTLLEAIALALGYSPEGGSPYANYKTTESTSNLHEVIRLVRSPNRPRDGLFLRAESFFNLATYQDEVDGGSGYGGPLHELSHGEVFLRLFTQRFSGKGLYILDEPEAALSPARQLTMMRAMHQLVEENSQFIIATHSPILLAYPHSKLYLFDATGISETAYQETEHYVLTKDFLNNHVARVGRLLS